VVKEMISLKMINGLVAVNPQSRIERIGFSSEHREERPRLWSGFFTHRRKCPSTFMLFEGLTTTRIFTKAK
jgi:hypothetical protein